MKYYFVRPVVCYIWDVTSQAGKIGSNWLRKQAQRTHRFLGCVHSTIYLKFYEILICPSCSVHIWDVTSQVENKHREPTDF